MNIFLRNVPPHASDEDLTRFFRPLLADFEIETFQCEKLGRKPFAVLTIVNPVAGHSFLQRYQTQPPSSSNVRLMYLNRYLDVLLARDQPDKFKLGSIRFAHQKKQLSEGKAATTARATTTPRQTAFQFHALYNGSWCYHQDHLLFQPSYSHAASGMALFGRRFLSLFLEANQFVRGCFRVDIPYYSMETILIGNRARPSVTFDLTCPPKLYSMPGPGFKIESHTGKTRVRSLGATHEECVGSCFSYQIILSNADDLDRLKPILSRSGMPAHIPYVAGYQSGQDFITGFRRFNAQMSEQEISGLLPFEILFQAHKLVANGLLPPGKMSSLFPGIHETKEKYGVYATVYALRQLAIDIPYPGPHIDGKTFELDELTKAINTWAQKFTYAGSMYELVARHDHLILAYRAMITPTGTYLNGPEVETTNRVMRKYSKYIDHFVRVTFANEDGEALQFDARTNLGEIYNQRFKTAMIDGIKIATRNYTFLGYSHSSLRSQSCWFMSPFVQDGQLVFSREVIKSLGDFSQMRSPARCSARIGQAFSDTTGAIVVDSGAVETIGDVKRNERCFSDGCGTISLALLQRVWKEHTFGRGFQPTTLQIRFSGAKGIVSLDERLEGEKLCLRKSMTKFASEDQNIEICGAANKSLPCFLNRQLIKILEDLDVPPKAFLELQAAAVDRLRRITLNPINASTFLEHSGHIGVNAQTPALLKMLHYIGIPYLEDPFLRQVVEHAALHHVRELKYRQRIPLDRGVTLYGVMDETGSLPEGKVHVILENRASRRVLGGGRVVVTRSPAYHPGDVQVLDAVDIPSGSPLDLLRNCIVFSQYGARDVPSMLSGGDLDGDLYQVIFEPSIFPRMAYKPADHPRVEPLDIGHEVRTEDMVDFFIKFMETDQLGRIATVHQQVADQKPAGTADPDCLVLAELASMAVDFSKTGIPVDLRKMPRHPRNRPDFMAPGPRALVGAKGPLLEEPEDEIEANDPISAYESQLKPIPYYPSEKVLGQLFRAIDEKQFFRSMQMEFNLQIQRTKDPSDHRSVLQRLWSFVTAEAAGFQWDHHVDVARELKRNYEDNLLDLTFSTDLHNPLTEVEVFCGIILGRSGQSKRQREQQSAIKEQFDGLVGFVVSRIKEVEPEEVLPRSIACLHVGIFEKKPRGRRRTELRSFAYIAAAIALGEVQRLQGGLLFKSTFSKLSLN